MNHFLDPTAEPVPSPPAGKVRWDNWETAITIKIVPHTDLSALVDALNEPSFADYRRAQCGAGRVRLSGTGTWMLVFIQGLDLTATLAVLRAQIARLTDITEWEEVTE